MGYACPVCDAPQADGEHLANHLAFTAMLHDDEHADFLDARVEDWEDRTPPELAAELIHHADQAAYDTVFEDTTGSGTPTPEAESDAPAARDRDRDATVDEETQRAIEEARKLFEGRTDDED